MESFKCLISLPNGSHSFLLDEKRTKKNQDLDLFAKKWKFLLTKFPNLNGNKVWLQI